MCYADERQLGAWKIDDMSGYCGVKANGGLRKTSVASSPLDNRIPSDNQMKKGFSLPEYYLSPGRNVNLSLGKHFAGAESAASRSFLVTADHDVGARTNMNKESASCFLNGDAINLMGAQYENSLFSSSLSHQHSQKLKVSSNNAVYSQSVTEAATSNYEEEGAFESLEELEAQTIGNLLPDDDDDLFSGVNDGLDSAMRPNNGEDLEDQDLFSSVGGLDLGEDGSSQKIFVLSNVNSSNQHRGVSTCGGEHPSRTLFVRNICSKVMDSDLQKLFEQYGDVRTLHTASKLRGFVIVSYYDIRASCNAMNALQNKSLMQRKLDINFSFPKANSSEDKNQGTIMVFNPDSSVSNNELREIFGVYGDIKEVHENPHNSHHKFVEFFDIRAAESALHALNRSGIAGKPIKLETNRPSPSRRLMDSISSELEREESDLQWLQHNAHANLTTAYSNNGTNVGHPRSANRGHTSQFSDNVLHPGVSSSVPNGISSFIRGESGSCSNIAESERLGYHLKFALQGAPNLHTRSPNLHPHSPNLHTRSPNLHPHSPNLHPYSLPEYYDSPANVTYFGSPSTLAANINVQPHVNDNHQFRRIGSNGHLMELNEVFGSSGNGSCPSPGHQNMWGNSHHQQSHAVVWPNSPSFGDGIGVGHPQQLHGVHRPPSRVLNPLPPLNNHHVGSAPSANRSIWDRRHAYAGSESPDAAMFHPGSLGDTRISGNSLHPLELLSPDAFLQTGGCMVFPARGQGIPMMSPYDSPSESTRHRRTESTTPQADNRKQFELDVDRIRRGDDKRTTLMIKNIPNKYTSKMLLAAIDERHKGTYDFIYLPIDFKNKCNVGYAFINITDPSLIVPFYQTFNGKKWEKFNSEKVATLAYARIQGKSALISHFQNSSLMNEDKRCRPVLFHTDGPNAGDQVPFPVGTNMRARGGKTRSSNEENKQETPSGSVNKDDCSNGDSSSGSGKESD